MSSIESERASAEARSDVAKWTTTAVREDDLLRYLGAVYYEARHGRANPEEVDRAVAHVDEHVRARGAISVPRQRP